MLQDTVPLNYTIASISGNKLITAQGGFEYRGRLSTLGITCANIDIINDAGVIVAQYLRRITKKLDLGVEFIHQYGIPVPGRQLSVVNYQARLPKFVIFLLYEAVIFCHFFGVQLIAFAEDQEIIFRISRPKVHFFQRFFGNLIQVPMPRCHRSLVPFCLFFLKKTKAGALALQQVAMFLYSFGDLSSSEG